MEITYEVDDKAYVSGAMRRIGLAVALLVVGNAVRSGDESVARVLGVSVFVCALVFGSAYYGVRRTLGRLRPGQRHLRFRFTAPHFVVADDESRHELGWETLSHYSKTRRGYEVYARDRVFWSIPFSAMSDAERALAGRWLAARLPTRRGGVLPGTRVLLLWGALIGAFYVAYHLIAP